jgi:hypothetical protein
MPLGHHYEKQARLGANFSYNSEEANFRTSLNGSAENALVWLWRLFQPVQHAGN